MEVNKKKDGWIIDGLMSRLLNRETHSMDYIKQYVERLVYILSFSQQWF
jgi:hypothetical protein